MQLSATLRADIQEVNALGFFTQIEFDGIADLSLRYIDHIAADVYDLDLRDDL